MPDYYADATVRRTIYRYDADMLITLADATTPSHIRAATLMALMARAMLLPLDYC